MYTCVDKYSDIQLTKACFISVGMYTDVHVCFYTMFYGKEKLIRRDHEHVFLN